MRIVLNIGISRTALPIEEPVKAVFALIPTLLLTLTALCPAAFADGEKEIPLTIKSQRFEPNLVKVPANAKFKLVIKNEGPGSEEFESLDLKREKIIPVGKTLVLMLGPLTPGDYKFFGDFHPDTAQGKLVAE